jgi:hypothetical protein
VAYGRILGALLRQVDSVMAGGDGGEANFLETEVVLAALPYMTSALKNLYKYSNRISTHSCCSGMWCSSFDCTCFGSAGFGSMEDFKLRDFCYLYSAIINCLHMWPFL